MMILFVVPKLPTDPQGEKYFRVEHHHSDGLTYSNCIINGEERYVYSTSRIERVSKFGKTILVHTRSTGGKDASVRPMKCADIPTVEVLRFIGSYQCWPTAANYRSWLNVPRFDRVRLAKRKEDTLVHRGYVTHYNSDGLFCDNKVFLTEKGEQRLKHLEQQGA